MSREPITTAAREAIRIADSYLPNASPSRRMALAKEIVAAIQLCEVELGEEIVKRITGKDKPCRAN